MTRYHLLPAARFEIKEAVRYYEAEQAGLGLEFLAKVREAIERVVAEPLSFEPLDSVHRKARTPRFPYGIIYRMDAGTVSVLAVMHLARRPEYWRGRQ